MKYVKLFEQFAQLSEAAETIDGIPSELFTMFKKIQVGKKVVGAGIQKKRFPGIGTPKDTLDSIPTFREEMEPVFKEIGLYNRKGVNIRYPQKPIEGVGSVRIDLGEFIRIDMSLFYESGSMRFTINNQPAMKIIKSVKGWGKYEDLIYAFQSILRSNISVLDAALSQPPVAKAHKHLDNRFVRLVFKRFSKLGLAENDFEQFMELYLTLSLMESPGNNRKKTLQYAIDVLQAHLKDKSFTDIDVSNRIQRGDGKIKSSDGIRYKAD